MQEISSYMVADFEAINEPIDKYIDRLKEKLNNIDDSAFKIKLEKEIRRLEENNLDRSEGPVNKCGTTKSYTKLLTHHEPCGFCALIIHNNKVYDYIVYRGNNVGEKFIE